MKRFFPGTRLTGLPLPMHLLLTVCLVIAGIPAAQGSAVIFSDNFSGSNLDPAWQVLPGQGSYSMVGDLRYNQEGPLSAPSGWGTTSLSLALPFTGLHWQADIEAKHTLMWLTSGNYTGPSNPMPSGSSGAQQSRVQMAFDPVTAGDRSALGGSNTAGFVRGVDAWYGSNYLTAFYDGTYVDNLQNPSDMMIQNNVADGTYWYRFIRDGGLLSIAYSYDGVNYFTAISQALQNPLDDANTLVLSGETYLSVGSYTDFQSVRILDTTVPEPGTSGLIGAGLLLIPIIRRRSRQRA